MARNKQSKDTLEILLSKYIAVWIWSISFGALSGITYSFIGGYYQISQWGPLSLLLVILMAIGILASIRAWLFMFQYLVNYIVPRFLYDSSEDQRGESDDTDGKYSNSGHWLRQAFLMMIVALAMRLALELTMLIFSVLQP